AKSEPACPQPTTRRGLPEDTVGRRSHAPGPYPPSLPPLRGNTVRRIEPGYIRVPTGEPCSSTIEVERARSGLEVRDWEQTIEPASVASGEPIYADDPSRARAPQQ